MANKTFVPRYTVIIQWSNEDGRFVVSLPEWGRGCKTHGDTYEEAAKNAREVLEMLMDNEQDPYPQPTPEPRLFHYPGADVVNLPDDDVSAPQAKTPVEQSEQLA